MRLRNLTHSPYPVPTKDGREVIIPAFEAVDVDIQDGYHLDDAFWRVESAEDQPTEPETKDEDLDDEGDGDEDESDDEDETSEEDESKDDADASEKADEEADTSGTAETPEAPQPVQRPVLSARKKGRRR